MKKTQKSNWLKVLRGVQKNSTGVSKIDAIKRVDARVGRAVARLADR